MSESKHTPGPWIVQQESAGEWSVWTRQPHIGTLALVFPEDINGDYPAEANARLIAAAPDLKAALAGMLNLFGGYECPEVDAAIIAMQAIGEDEWSMQAQMDAAKAEGRS